MIDLPPWRVRWTNFRGYERSPDIDLPALSLLIGRNNVGKTSSYSPLLLLRQTLDAKNSDTALLFRGDTIDFGSYSDVVTDHDSKRHMTMRLELGVTTRRQRGRGDTAGGAIQGVEVEFEHHASQTRLVRSTVFNPKGDAIVERTLRDDGLYNVVSPLLLANRDVGRPPREVTELRRDMEAEEPDGFLFSGISGILLPTSWRSNSDRWNKVQKWYQGTSQIYDVYQQLNRYLENALRSISYIGPLRSSPRRSYLTSAERPSGVGRDGEWAAELLFRARNTEKGVYAKTNHWLEKLGYGGMDFDTQGDYFRAFVTRPGSKVRINFADCGMGLAQLLPIIVEGSSMEPGSTLIVQQPEIHLNPAQQDLITDFLLELAVSGIRVIVESHSEHVLTRLRRRIAEGESLAETELAVYFCDSSNDRSTIERIPVGALGEIQASDWPTGFFQEQLDNALELARAQSRRRSK